MDSLKLFFELSHADRLMKHKKRNMNLFKNKKNKKRKKKRKIKKQIYKYKAFEGEPTPSNVKSPKENDTDSVSPSPFKDSIESDTKPMSEKEFISWMRRLKYYKLRYMNYKMIVGIDQHIITEDTRCVLANIKKAIRFQIYNLLNVTPTSIVKRSKYKTDQIKIIELDVILTSIDETQPMNG